METVFSDFQTHKLYHYSIAFPQPACGILTPSKDTVLPWGFSEVAAVATSQGSRESLVPSKKTSSVLPQLESAQHTGFHHKRCNSH